MTGAESLDPETVAVGEAQAAHPQSVNRQILHALMSIASATLLVRMAGMGMQIAVTARFGLGASMDAYLIAAAIPVLVATVAVSALEGAIVPVYVRVRSAGDREQASRLFSTLINLLLIAAVVLTLLMLAFRHQVIQASAPAADPFRHELAARLAPIIFPALVLTVVLGVLESVLNAEGQYGWPAYAGLLVPLVTTAVILAAGQSLGIVTLAIGTLIGLALQSCAFIIRVRRAGIIYRPVLALHHPALPLVFIAGWPLLLDSGIGQISPLIDQMFASGLSAGSISALSYALKLISVPTGVVFAAVGRATLPFLARYASNQDIPAFKAILRLYAWIVGISIALLSVLMILLAHPVVEILLQRGAFTPGDADRTATILIGFTIGLLPMSLGFLIARAFSALGKNRVLMYVSMFMVTANALFDYFLSRAWQGFGIALATSAVYTGTLVILLFTLRRVIGPLDLLSMPPELQSMLHSGRLRRYTRISAIASGIPDALMTRLTAMKEMKPFKHLPQRGRSTDALTIGAAVLASGTGIAIGSQDAISALHMIVGLAIIVVWLRYPYTLLLSWALIGPFIGKSHVPIFSGNNFDTALTVPTLLLMASMPLRQAFKRMPALLLFAGFLLWVLMGINASPLDHTSFLKQWAIFVDYIGVAVLTINVLTTKRRMMIFVNSLLSASAVIALYGIYGYVTHQNTVVSGGEARITSFFDAVPALALFLSIVVPLALYRTLSVRRSERIVNIGILCSMLLGVVLTFTRGAFVSIGFSLVVMVLLLPSRRMKFAVIATALFGGIALTLSNISLFSRFSSGDIVTLNGRTYLWNALLEHFDPGQLLGNGLNASNYFLAGLANGGNVRVAGTVATSASNLYVGVLYDQGIVGLGLLVVTFVALAIGLSYGMRNAVGEHRILFVMALVALLGVVVQSAEQNDILAQSIAVYFWMIMALPFARCWSRSPTVSGATVLSGDEANGRSVGAQSARVGPLPRASAAIAHVSLGEQLIGRLAGEPRGTGAGT